MIFSSIPFLYYFLPAVLICYFIVPKQLKNLVLLVFSLLFYAWGEPKYIFLMLISIIFGYGFGIWIAHARKHSNRRYAQIVLGLSVLFHIGLLGYFKYADFFIENVNALTGANFALLKLALPIGISFYTFQILSYTVDVYRGEVAPQKNFISLAAYVSLFPQLIAGPIVRYQTVCDELSNRTHSFANFACGMRRFVLGLAKKILIANTLGEFCEIFVATSERSVLFYWVYAVAVCLHIYFDFSGYSDMAIGLGRCFGFHFNENFNYPFISGSITEFWRRWHISLGSWFRDYVYIPLGGNRGAKWKWFRNIAIVWLLTGLWHGAAWNFVLWGVMFAVLLVLEKVFLAPILQKHKVFAHIYVAIMILISFLIFNSTDFATILQNLGGMVSFGSLPLVTDVTLYYVKSYLVILLAAAVGSTPLIKNTVLAIRKNVAADRVIGILEPFFYVLLLVVMTGFLVDGSFNPFLYFRF